MQERPFTLGSVALQERDFALLRGLFESRLMTAKHVSSMYFEDKAEYCKTRLRQLKTAGYIRARERRVNEPAMLSLTKKGFLALKQAGELIDFPEDVIGAASFEARSAVSELTLRHELQVMDVKAAFFKAVRESENLKIEKFVTWPKLCQFEAQQSSAHPPRVVFPDGFIRIAEGDEISDFFLEVDRSSETLERLVGKILCYVNYFRMGGYAVSNGGRRENFKEFPFRVLVVVKSIQRRDNLARRLREQTPPILTQVLIAIIAQSTIVPMKKIWVMTSGETTRLLPN